MVVAGQDHHHTPIDEKAELMEEEVSMKMILNKERKIHQRNHPKKAGI
jgi:hypothetical protein